MPESLACVRGDSSSLRLPGAIAHQILAPLLGACAEVSVGELFTWDLTPPDVDVSSGERPPLSFDDCSGASVDYPMATSLWVEMDETADTLTIRGYDDDGALAFAEARSALATRFASPFLHFRSGSRTCG